MENIKDHDCSQHHSGIGGVYQTLDELDFIKGPWVMAMNGDYPGICIYLEKGGDPNARDSSGYSLLHYAARNGHQQICNALITHHAHVNATTKSGKATALHRAAYAGHFKIVQKLIDCKADVTVVDEDGKTPLHKAAENNKAECCKILLKANPDMQYVKDRKVKYPKDYVPCTESHSETYKLLWWRNENTS